MEIKYLQVLIMPNGEIFFLGKSIGWVDNLVIGCNKKYKDFIYSTDDLLKKYGKMEKTNA